MNDDAEPPTKKKGYRCYFCGEKFLDLKELKKHITAHKDRPYECEICDRTFSAEYTLQKHMLVHTKEKPFMCEKCGKTFNQKWNLKKHIERHDAKSGEKAVRVGIHNCHGCDKGARYPNLLCAQCTFHGKRIGEDGKYFCALCYLVFENIAVLNSHVLEQHRICEKKRLQRATTELHYDCFRCTICKRGFKREQNLNKHSLKCGQVKKYPPRKRKPKLKVSCDL